MVAFEGFLKFQHAFSQSSDHDIDFARSTARTRDDKFVAAKTSDRIIRTQRGSQSAGDDSQSRIAGHMTEVVVDGFEVIEIDQDNGQLLSASACSVEFRVQRLVECCSVWQPCNGIALRRLQAPLNGPVSYTHLTLPTKA